MQFLLYVKVGQDPVNHFLPSKIISDPYVTNDILMENIGLGKKQQ